MATLLVLTNLAEAVSFRGVRNATCHFDFVGIVDNISSNRLNFTDANGHYAQFYCANGIPPDVSEGDVIRASGYAFPSGNPLDNLFPRKKSNLSNTAILRHTQTPSS